MGSEISAEKCKTLSTSPGVREAMRGRTYGAEGVTIPVCTSMRDLGSHLTLAKRSVGPTLARRLEAATEVVKRIGQLPVARETKIALVNGKACPMGLYGVEATPIPKAQMRSFRSAVASALDCKAATHRSVNLTLTLAGPRTPDPLLHAGVKRITAFRRAWWKLPDVRVCMLCAYD
eukprot:636525-Alexandrium_andersonii.AAC.1